MAAEAEEGALLAACAGGAPRPGTLCARLWSDSADLAHASLMHPFVQAMATGDLPLATFQHYISQDAVFLASFARAYELAIAQCGDGEGHAHARATLTTLHAGVDAELRLHDAYCLRWRAACPPPPMAALCRCSPPLAAARRRLPPLAAGRRRCCSRGARR
jgi:thiaminase/transcriptional activator TenA